MYRLEQLWRFTSLTVYSQQAGDLGELMASSSLSPKVWEPERLEGLTPQKSLCVSLSEPESGGKNCLTLKAESREFPLNLSTAIPFDWILFHYMERLWCWERLKAGGEGDDRGWDGWMASPTQWRWVWVNSGSWWWTGRPGVLWSMGLRRVGHNWATQLNWMNILRSICRQT